MKQKIVLKVDMRTGKCRQKALETAARTDGVTSIAVKGAERDRLVVVGVRIDAATLTKSLRKKVGHTDIISVKTKRMDDGEEENNYGGSYSGYDYYPPYSGYDYYPPYRPPPPGYDMVPYGTPWFPDSPPVYDMVPYGTPWFPDSWFNS